MRHAGPFALGILALAMLVASGGLGCSKSPAEKRQAASHAVARGEASRSRPFVASVGREPYHRSTCRWARKISPDHLVGYDTREEAVADGHRACEVCRP